MIAVIAGLSSNTHLRILCTSLQHSKGASEETEHVRRCKSKLTWSLRSLLVLCILVFVHAGTSAYFVANSGHETCHCAHREAENPNHHHETELIAQKAAGL